MIEPRCGLFAVLSQEFPVGSTSNPDSFTTRFDEHLVVPFAIRIVAGKYNCSDDHRSQTIQERLASVRRAPLCSPCFLRKTKRLITLLAVRAFGPVRFAFSNQTVLSSVSFRLMRRTENCDSEHKRCGEFLSIIILDTRG